MSEPVEDEPPLVPRGPARLGQFGPREPGGQWPRWRGCGIPSGTSQLVQVAPAGEGVYDYGGKDHLEVMARRFDVTPEVEAGVASYRQIARKRTLLLQLNTKISFWQWLICACVVQALFLDICSKTQAKKLKTQDFFAQNSKFRPIFQKYKKIFYQI